MDEFLIRALLGGIGVALAAGPLGAFIVWRRMAYFGDTLAHAALFGVALGVLLGTSINLGVIVICVLLAAALAGLQQQRRIATDTLLGILSHGTLSLGLVTLAFLQGVRVDLLGYLFGDILAITNSDILWIWGGGAAALTILALIWRPLLSLTVHEELARVEGVPVASIRLIYMVMIALVVAVAMKVVGILLVTSMLIIPAAAARAFSRTPEQMAILASGIGCLAVAGGLWSSLQWDLPAGPAVVVTAVLLFLLSPHWLRRTA